MKLSTKTRYGLRILIQIALSCDQRKAVKGKFIAAKQDISEAYLEQIMIPLKNADIIRTLRGCNGGYALKRQPEEITVLDIIELFEGKVNLVKCVEDEKECYRCSYCLANRVWGKLADSLRKEAGAITLDQLISEAKTMNTPEYVI